MVIADGHFNLPQWFVWVWMGKRTHFITQEGHNLTDSKVLKKGIKNICAWKFNCYINIRCRRQNAKSFRMIEYKMTCLVFLILTYYFVNLYCICIQSKKNITGNSCSYTTCICLWQTVKTVLCFTHHSALAQMASYACRLMWWKWEMHFLKYTKIMHLYCS